MKFEINMTLIILSITYQTTEEPEIDIVMNFLVIYDLSVVLVKLKKHYILPTNIINFYGN